MGIVVASPHGSFLGAVGGFPGGFMGAFNTAALDAIFWLHHANIDRLWEVWLKRDPAFVNPTDADWLKAKGAKFEFHDAKGSLISLTPRQVVDTTAALLGYQYEDVSDPLAISPSH